MGFGEAVTQRAWVRMAAAVLAAAVGGWVGARAAAPEPPTPEVGSKGEALVTYQVDPARSSVRFALPATLHTVEGKTTSVSGSFTRPAAATSGDAFEVTGRITIAARTLDTGNGSRDKRMRAESLAVDTYPEIVFVPSRGVGKNVTFAPGSKSAFTLEGKLTVRGVTKPVSIETSASFTESGMAADGKTQLTFADFGVPDPSNFLLHVKPTLTVSFHLEARAGR